MTNKTTATPKKTTRTVSGSELTPATTGGTGVSKQEWYWVGVYPSCPVEQLDVGGVAFPKLTTTFTKSTGRRRQEFAIPAVRVVGEAHAAQS